MSWVLVCYRRPAKHGDMTRVAAKAYGLLRYNTISKQSSGELLRETYELLRYNTILRLSSDEFTKTFLRVSAITVRLPRVVYKSLRVGKT